MPTSVAIAATDYVSQTIDYSNNDFNGLNEFAIPDVSLKSITGATISVGFTYTTVEERLRTGTAIIRTLAIHYIIVRARNQSPSSTYSIRRLCC